jgi:hypothetical protein
VRAGDEWIPYQEMFLEMVSSIVDEVAAKFNADSMGTRHDPLPAQL